MNYDAMFKMIGEIIDLCPDELWNVSTDESPFWQQLYHALFFADFYNSESMGSFKKPSFIEEKAAALKYVVSEVPSREQMQEYLEIVKGDCKTALDQEDNPERILQSMVSYDR